MTLFSISTLVLPQCTDSKHHRYSLIASNNVPTPAECAQFCHKLPSPYLVGFEYIAKKGFCNCLYSGQNLPTPPSGFTVEIYTSDIGTGPNRGSDGGVPGVVPGMECYAFVQVRGVLALCTLIRKSSRYINSLYFLFLI